MIDSLTSLTNLDGPLVKVKKLSPSAQRIIDLEATIRQTELRNDEFVKKVEEFRQLADERFTTIIDQRKIIEMLKEEMLSLTTLNANMKGQLNRVRQEDVLNAPTITIPERDRSVPGEGRARTISKLDLAAPSFVVADNNWALRQELQDTDSYGAGPRTTKPKSWVNV